MGGNIMATWGLHMRITQNLLNRGFDLEPLHFLVGNIAPDCGVPEEGGLTYIPEKRITHWHTSKEPIIDAEAFASAYLTADALNPIDKDRYSFLLGYYVHLLTDIEFSKLTKDKRANDPKYKPLEVDMQFFHHIKRDWYDLDHKFFRDHPGNLFHKHFQYITDYPDVLDYYPKGSITHQIRNIIEFYQHPSTNLDREYVYLNEAEMDAFLESATKVIGTKLNNIMMVNAG